MGIRWNSDGGGCAGDYENMWVLGGIVMVVDVLDTRRNRRICGY